MIPVSEKKDLHALIDALPPAEVPAARRFLEFLSARADADGPSAALRALRDAPDDDESVSREDIAAARAGEIESLAGKLVPTAEVRRRIEARKR